MLCVYFCRSDDNRFLLLPFGRFLCLRLSVCVCVCCMSLFCFDHHSFYLAHRATSLLDCAVPPGSVLVHHLSLCALLITFYLCVWPICARVAAFLPLCARMPSPQIWNDHRLLFLFLSFNIFYGRYGFYFASISFSPWLLGCTVSFRLLRSHIQISLLFEVVGFLSRGFSRKQEILLKSVNLLCNNTLTFWKCSQFIIVEERLYL